MGLIHKLNIMSKKTQESNERKLFSYLQNERKINDLIIKYQFEKTTDDISFYERDSELYYRHFKDNQYIIFCKYSCYDFYIRKNYNSYGFYINEYLNKKDIGKIKPINSSYSNLDILSIVNFTLESEECQKYLKKYLPEL